MAIKRTGYVLMETLLRLEGYKIISNDSKLYDFIIKILTGEIRFEEIVIWLKQNTSPFKFIGIFTYQKSKPPQLAF